MFSESFQLICKAPIELLIVQKCTVSMESYLIALHSIGINHELNLNQLFAGRIVKNLLKLCSLLHIYLLTERICQNQSAPDRVPAKIKNRCASDKSLFLFSFSFSSYRIHKVQQQQQMLHCSLR